MKKIYMFVVFMLMAVAGYAQSSKSTTIGAVSKNELEMLVYEKDTTANAVVLLEHGNYYMNSKKDYKHTTDFYFKVKILKKEGLEKAVINIPVYDKDEIHDIKGISYALSKAGNIQKKHLLEKDIYTKDLNNSWREVSFTLPDVQVGGVIEYCYSVTSPYSTIDDWDFQSDIPKVKSDFTASILGNWTYNASLIGFLKLTRNEAKIEKDCIDIPRLGSGSCVILEYGMDDIPAFEEEAYMLSAENFKSSIGFQLVSFANPQGGVEKYTKTWDDADKKLRTDFLDNQAAKKGYFKRNLPETLLAIPEPLEKAKQAYSYIKNHFSWNGKYWPDKKVRVKDAFEEKTGNIFDINLALFNTLQALEVESYLVLTATRNKAMPTKLFPVINQFNYLFVKAVIDGKVYYLDASEKNLPFGMVQFQAINGEGRVLDFKKGSFWEPITMDSRTAERVKVMLDLEATQAIHGKLMISSLGYKAVNRRETIQQKSKEQYMEEVESKYPSMLIEDVQFTGVDTPEKPLRETYVVELETNTSNEVVRLNPFLIGRNTINPFKLNTRDYPVDFGYAREFSYTFLLNLPEGYTIKNIQENKAYTLPNSGGKMTLANSFKGNKYQLFFKWTLNKSIYSSEEYFTLKEYFKNMITIQDFTLEIVKE